MKLPLALAAAVALGGCAELGHRAPPSPAQSEVEQRAYQSRTYEGTSEQEILRMVVATLQDLDYEVERLSPDLGVVGGTRRRQRITVTVHTRGDGQVVVRATLHSKRGTTRNRWPYQQFFAALEKSRYLKANDVD